MLLASKTPSPSLRWPCISAAAAALSCSATLLGGTIFDVTQWDLGTGVQATFPHGAGVFSQTVTNPFISNHLAIDGNSSASTTYNVTWDDRFGDFLVEVTHRAADVDPASLRSISDGLIYVTANTDLLISINGIYSYSLPVDPMEAEFDMTVFDPSPPYDSPIGFANLYNTSVDGAPASGSFPIGGQAILPAGHTWLIRYTMELFTYYGYSGQIASGDGYLHFTLQAVPEPAALGLLALGGAMIRRRRPC